MAHTSLVFRARAALGQLRSLPARLRHGLTHAQGTTAPPPLNVTILASHAEYLRHRERTQSRARARDAAERALLDARDSFRVDGFCYPCGAPSAFEVDYRYGSESEGVRIPNWRETLICECCGLNNRLRASVELFDRFCRAQRTDRIYITEQTTPMYRWLVDRYAQVTGSEYLGDRIPFGAVNAQGVRNESLTQLSFPDATFDRMISFDVLEHIPDVAKALRECHRCLKPGGHLLLSVPFVVSAEHTLVRARVSANGEVEHLLPPEYHGDPLSSDGCLCFYHFGWDLLEQLRASGFGEARVLLYWSRELGYLGGEQLQIFATK
ncbi:class I SAM-dependent methyltransferase [Thiocystis violascens]|uniref:Methylase involved in ubiquinone/menaquinone biosynthesis n=1 Tax=Thiocystis violascens (strain ATCC 17096 / DSM 198 / 6111) TaxID=765911 RepID=I3YC83_THIV6|nr:class I SAM-dependent methyltransferase [Thiocystis violascens]AFL74601.1 methylase involved in ubiquinone/menaquinone biosynthesis [Thiocystis violascens DSM 198]